MAGRPVLFIKQIATLEDCAATKALVIEFVTWAQTLLK